MPGLRSPTTSSWPLRYGCATMCVTHMYWMIPSFQTFNHWISNCALCLFLLPFFQSFTELQHRPQLVDLTVEEGQRLKVIYGSSVGFHVIDVDSGNPYDIYIPSHVSAGPERLFSKSSTNKFLSPVMPLSNVGQQWRENNNFYGQFQSPPDLLLCQAPMRLCCFEEYNDFFFTNYPFDWFPFMQVEEWWLLFLRYTSL